MPFPVQCRCGQRFMAQDWLAGKTVSCPACGSALRIPSSSALRPAGSAAGVPQWLDSVSSAPVGLPQPTRGDEEAFSPGLKVAIGVAAGMVGLLLVVIVLQTLLSGRRGPAATGGGTASSPTPPASAEAPTEAVPPIAKPRYGPPPGAGRAPPADTAPWAQYSDEPEETIGGAPSSEPSFPVASGADDGMLASTTAPLEPASGAAAGPLPVALERWHTTASGPLQGARAVGDEEFVLFHYSWMCELLPFLGHEALYQQFDFRKPWNDPVNASLGTTVIPEFLNPADDRQQWTGSRLRNLALTHFVGMSGVEDSRNVVAAMLPRSDPRAGIFGYGEVARREQITDGTSHTIMLVGSGEVTAPWVQGGGATIRGARQPYFDPLTGFGSRGLAQPGAVVLMADGATRHLSADIDPAVFRALCTIRGGEAVDADQIPPAVADFPGVR